MAKQSGSDLEKFIERSDINNQEIVSYGPASEERKGLYERTKNIATDYLVDVSAAWTFYTPLYGGIELIAGMEGDEILKARAMSLGVHAVIGRPVGALRNKLAEKWKVTKESRWYEQIGVNLCSVLPIQAVLYTGMLIASGASKEEIAAALPMGLVIGAGLTEPFGRWMDIWRKVWKKKA